MRDWRTTSARLRNNHADFLEHIRFMSKARVVVALTAALLVGAGTTSSAQLVPSERWYTIETAHFRVHFVKALESEGRRGAVNAERAYGELSTELRPPSGKVDLVIADNVDYVQGYATTFPTNRIVIYAHPPIDTPELRNYDDWSRLVITHELTHIFHLDRSDGLWRVGRNLFGRNVLFFPNSYEPSWLVEGLAVYYESRVTGSGRLEGPEHYMIARAAAEAHRLPRLDELSRATTRFPGGESVYAYGSQIFDYLSRTRGPETIPKFIDIASRAVFPLSLNAKAKQAFGISFENAFRDWSDSLTRASVVKSDPLRGWRQLTNDGRYIEHPRWDGDSAILYTAANGRESPALYRASLDGTIKNLGRRSGLDVNVPMSNGDIVFAQPEYTDAFHYRNDLYRIHDGVETRLTSGARLSAPDVRPDGEIVAVQAIPGSSRLARVSADGARVRHITAGTAEVQWASPRWSPDGREIVALRVGRGNVNDLVTLDSVGKITRVVFSITGAIVADPSWSPSGDRIYYTSTQSGSMQAYSVSLAGNDFVRLSSTTTGLFQFQPSHAGDKYAALDFRYDGYHLGFAPAPLQTVASNTDVTGLRSQCSNCRLAASDTPPISLSDLPPDKPYSAWQSLIPRYWDPLITIASGSGNVFGAATRGEDIIGRHSYYAQAGYNAKYHETEAFASYQYAGLGQPYINSSVEQTFDHFTLADNAGKSLGRLDRRARFVDLSASLMRPRARSYASLALGGEMEVRNYVTDPDTLLSRLPVLFSRTLNYPSVFASASWSNVQRPALSISREDGIAFGTSARRRWRTGDASTASNSILGTVSAYKSLDLPGFSHHAIAVRAAGAIADDNAISTFSAGGVSGGSLEIVSGISVGADRRTFGVRGFPSSAEQGIRALGGTAEYRAPISAPSARVPFIPLLFDKISIATFGEAGRAWCPASAAQSIGVCNGSARSQPWLASVGAEADFDTAVQYDVPTRFRVGFAVPVLNRAAGRANSASFYFAVGSAF